MSRFGTRGRAATRANAWMPKGFIRSVTYGTVALADTVATNTAAISINSVSNAVVQFLGIESESTTTQSSYARVALTSTTAVTATREAAALALTVAFVVVEFWPGVLKSVQEFLVSLTAGNVTNTATLSPVVVPNKTWLVHRGWGITSGDVEAQGMSRATLTNGSTVTAIRFTGTNDATYYGTAVEFLPL